MTQLKLLEWVSREHSYITRGNDLRLEKSRTDLHKYYFTNRAVNIWNSLPKHVVLSDTVNELKFHLNEFWQLCMIIIMIIRLKFTELEAEVNITRISYMRLQYFGRFIFMMRASRHWHALVIPLRLRLLKGKIELIFLAAQSVEIYESHQDSHCRHAKIMFAHMPLWPTCKDHWSKIFCWFNYGLCAP